MSTTLTDVSSETLSVYPATRSFRNWRARKLNLKKDFRRSWIVVRNFLNRNRWKCLISVVAVLAVCVFAVNPVDQSLLDGVRGGKKDKVLDNIAGEIGHWGDFAQFNLGGSFLIWLVGYIFTSRWLQRLAFATLVAAILAGVSCNAFRFSLGRSRPKAPVEDRFYGFEGVAKGWNFHSFPSGHCSTAFGSGVPFAAAAGVWGAPVVVFSGSVGWARMYKNQHYPTDVIVGAFLGCLFGIASSWRLRKIRFRLKRRKKHLRVMAKQASTLPGGLVAE